MSRYRHRHLLSSLESAKSGASGSDKKLIWVVIIVVGCSLLVFVLLMLCLWKKVMPYLQQKWNIKGGLKGENLKLRCFEIEELERATDHFSEECLLGSGAFGNVYKGTFDDCNQTLAIKRAHAASYQTLEEFRNEVRLLAKVNHRNLVGLVGFCEEAGAKGAKALVYEYVPNGSLLDYIMGRGGKSLTWRQRVDIAIGAAKGIAHLHEGINPSIIHRDIKPSNILVGEGFEAKVSDFGLVKMGPVGDQSHVSSQIKGTPGYLDPAYCTSYHLSPLSDVYSFGVILLQLIAARPAVDLGRNSNYHIIEWARPSIENGNIEDIIDANLLSEPLDMETMLKMGQLALKCVVKSPKDRPTMTQVYKQLEQAVSRSDHTIRSTVSSSRNSSRSSLDKDHISSQSFASLDSITFQRFRIDMDSSQSFQNPSFMRFEMGSDSTIIDVDRNRNSMNAICETENRDEDRNL